MEHFNGRAILADDMGLGKTLQSLWYAHRNKTFPILIVCPASVKYNWQKEALTHFGWDARVLESRTPPRTNELFDEKVLIINFEILGYWLKYLSRYKFKLIIIDECHRIKNPDSLRSKNVRTMCKGGLLPRKKKGEKRRRRKRIPHTLFLSGTPIENYPIEIWPVLNIIDPKSWPSRQAFGMKHCRMKVTPWDISFTAAKEPKRLRRILRTTCMIRRRKKDVLSQLPDKTRTIIPIKLDAAAQKEYRHASNNFINWLMKTNPTKVHKAKKAKHFVRGGYLKRLAAQLKLPWTVNWIDDFLEQHETRKLIVFGIHTKMLMPLHKQYNDCSVIVNGRVKGRKRHDALERFIHDDACQVFFGNMHACGTGVDGLQVADMMLMLECPYNPGLLLQTEDRAHRIGQKNALGIYYPIAEGTVEAPLFKVLERKQEGINSTLDMGENAMSELDIWSLVLEEMKKDKI